MSYIRQKSGIRLLVFLLATAVCGGCGYWIYFWSQTGQLYTTGFKAMFLRMAILAIPYILTIILDRLYYPESGDMEFIVISLVLNIFFPIAGTICASAGFFGISPKLYYILQVAIPLGLTYLMCLQAIIFYNNPPKYYYKSPYDTTTYDPSIYTDPVKDLDSHGLPSGKGY
jgi:hypothetical protein